MIGQQEAVRSQHYSLITDPIALHAGSHQHSLGTYTNNFGDNVKGLLNCNWMKNMWNRGSPGSSSPQLPLMPRGRVRRAGLTQLAAACLLLIAKVFGKVIRQVGLTASSCVAVWLFLPSWTAAGKMKSWLVTAKVKWGETVLLRPWKGLWYRCLRFLSPSRDGFGGGVGWGEGEGFSFGEPLSFLLYLLPRYSG